jgi:Nitroreductase family
MSGLQGYRNCNRVAGHSEIEVMITRRKALVFGAGAVAAGFGGYWTVNAGPSYDDAVRSTWLARTATVDGFLDYLVHHATLAANSHNTQPWLFGKIAERVTIQPDLSRSTPVVDPDGHHLFASLGCAAENLILAANAAGKGAALAFDANGDGRIEIDFAGNAVRDPLFDAILERQCTRSDYDGQPVSNEDLDALVNAAKVEGCELIMIPEKSRIEQALELVVAANTAQVGDPAFTAELKSWLRFSAAKAIATGDGLYAACSGNPTMPQWLGNIVFGFVFKPESENDRYAKQIRSSSALAVFFTDKNDRQHWVQAGRSYQRFALKATSLGIRNAFINQPVEVASLREEFSRLPGIEGKRPDLIVRFGHAPAMPKSLRRPTKEVIVQA